MKTLTRFLVLAGLLWAGRSANASSLAEHDFFKHYMGKWTAEGTLKGENGNDLKVTEDWTGRPEGENSIIMEGSRTINGETSHFKWSISHNTSTDTYDAVLTGKEEDQPLRFEATLSEVNMTLDLKALTGQNSAITVTEKFGDDKRESIISHVTFTNDQGLVTLEGDIANKKMKEP